MSNGTHSGLEGRVEKDTDIEDLLGENLDSTDYEIYRALNEDGRMSDTELSEKVGLSRTAVRRRRKQLQEENVIKVIGLLILQEVDLNYADVRVTTQPDASRESIDQFISSLMDEELVYEVNEYMGRSDILVRVWHASLQDIKQYVNQLLQHDTIKDYEITPVTRTHKAWHSNITENGES